MEHPKINPLKNVKMKYLKIMASLALVLSLGSLSAQKLMTRNGMVKFYSAAPLENIEAVNSQTSSVLDLDKGQFAFLVPIKGFIFEKALMQEHFNERYLESDKYPNGKFQGSMSGLEKIDIDQDGQYPVSFSGVMEIHGTEKKIEEKGVLNVKDGQVTLESEFKLKPGDYGVKIPSSKKDNISETLDMTVKIDYDKK